MEREEYKISRDEVTCIQRILLYVNICVYVYMYVHTIIHAHTHTNKYIHICTWLDSYDKLYL